MCDADGVAAFLGSIAEVDGHDAMSEAKMLRLADGAPEIVTIAGDDGIVAVGIAAPHPQPDGATHWAVETAVRPDLRFEPFESTVLERTLASVPVGSARSCWSNRRSLDMALDGLGYTPVRRLLHLEMDLPMDEVVDDDPTIRPVEEGEIGDLLALNRAAFAEHREAVSLDRTAFEILRREPWFDLQGILVAPSDDGLAGFCWTKVHADGDGEIYRVGVHPDRRGSGVGRALVVQGFAHLQRHAEVRRGTLWVDASNQAAVTLYRSLGMRTDRAIAEFEPSR